MPRRFHRPCREPGGRLAGRLLPGRVRIRSYATWLQADDSIVIEDGILSGLFPETYPGCSSGPHQAVKRFLSANGDRYRIDAMYCDFLGHNVTWASNGFLRKTA